MRFSVRVVSPAYISGPKGEDMESPTMGARPVLRNSAKNDADAAARRRRCPAAGGRGGWVRGSICSIRPPELLPYPGSTSRLEGGGPRARWLARFAMVLSCPTHAGIRRLFAALRLRTACRSVGGEWRQKRLLLEGRAAKEESVGRPRSSRGLDIISTHHGPAKANPALRSDNLLGVVAGKMGREGPPENRSNCTMADSAGARLQNPHPLRAVPRKGRRLLRAVGRPMRWPRIFDRPPLARFPREIWPPLMSGDTTTGWAFDSRSKPAAGPQSADLPRSPSDGGPASIRSGRLHPTKK